MQIVWAQDVKVVSPASSSFLQKKINGQKYAQIYSQECSKVSPAVEHHQV